MTATKTKTKPKITVDLEASNAIATALDAVAAVSADNDTLETLVNVWRARQDLKRAYMRLDLQCQSMCRRFLGTSRADDKDDEKSKKLASALWSSIRKGDDISDRVGGTMNMMSIQLTLQPYIAAMDTMKPFIAEYELKLKKLARTMPLWKEWGANVRGLGELSFAGFIGEAVHPITNYRSPAALWKRFGLAVFDGERQRLTTNADLAILYGYSPTRRSFAYVIGTNLIKAQKVDSPEDKYRAIYDARKLYELERGIPKAHAHNRAMRNMTKALIKDAWMANRKIVEA